MDVDKALSVRLGVLGVEHIHLVKFLSADRAVLQHRAHSGIAVDVRVLALQVVLLCGLERKILVYLHKAGVHLACAGSLGTVKYIRLGGRRMTFFDQYLFHAVLYLLNGGVSELFLHQHIADLARKL